MVYYPFGNWLNYAINQFDVYTSRSGNSFLFFKNIFELQRNVGECQNEGGKTAPYTVFSALKIYSKRWDKTDTLYDAPT